MSKGFTRTVSIYCRHKSGVNLIKFSGGLVATGSISRLRDIQGAEINSIRRSEENIDLCMCSCLVVNIVNNRFALCKILVILEDIVPCKFTKFL